MVIISLILLAPEESGVFSIRLLGAEESGKAETTGAMNPRAGRNSFSNTIYYSLYSICVMSTTIAVKESTREKLKKIMKEEGTKSLDQTINALIERAGGVPKSMFGADRKRGVGLSRREHEEFQR